MKPVGAACLVLMTTVFNTGPSVVHLVLLAAMLFTVFASSELLGGMSHGLAIMESTDTVGPGKGALQNVLFEANYSVGNLAIVASRLAIAAVRAAWPSSPRTANTAVLLVGCALHVVAAVAFWWGHGFISQRYPMQRPRPTERPRPCPQIGSKSLRERAFWLYMASILAFAGIDFVFFHMSYTLPKCGRVLCSASNG
jgi:hypothetical protein